MELNRGFAHGIHKFQLNLTAQNLKPFLINYCETRSQHVQKAPRDFTFKGYEPESYQNKSESNKVQSNICCEQ